MSELPKIQITAKELWEFLAFCWWLASPGSACAFPQCDVVGGVVSVATELYARIHVYSVEPACRKRR